MARQKVASTKDSRRIEIASELEKGDSTMAFRIAKQRARENRDIIGMPCIHNENGNLKTGIGKSEVSCEMFSNEVCVKELCGVLNGLLIGKNMPESWKRSTVPMYKNK